MKLSYYLKEKSKCQKESNAICLNKWLIEIDYRIQACQGEQRVWTMSIQMIYQR